MYTCILDYVYVYIDYAYMQDIYAYMQDNYVYIHDNHVYIITWYFYTRHFFQEWKMCVVMTLQGHTVLHT